MRGCSAQELQVEKLLRPGKVVGSRKESWEAGAPSEGTLWKALWPLLGCEGELGHRPGADGDRDGFGAFLSASIPSHAGSVCHRNPLHALLGLWVY